MTGIDRDSYQHSSSDSYYLQVANATSSACYVCNMNKEELRAWRVVRLRDAIAKVTDGNVTAFGKRLGLKDGAYIRQLLAGTRGMTENIVYAIEQLPGMKGWFDHSDAAQTGAPGPAGNRPPTSATQGVRAHDEDIIRRAVILLEQLLMTWKGEMQAVDKADALLRICRRIEENPQASDKEIVVSLLKLAS